MSDQQNLRIIAMPSEGDSLWQLADVIDDRKQYHLAWLNESDLDALMKALLNTKHFANKIIVSVDDVVASVAVERAKARDERLLDELDDELEARHVNGEA